MNATPLLRKLSLVSAFAFLAYLILSIRPAGTRPRGTTGEVAETLVKELKGVRDQVRFRDFVYDEDRADGQGFRIKASEAIGFRELGDEFYRLKDVLLEFKGVDPRSRGLVVGAPRAEFKQTSKAMKIFDGVFIERDGISIQASRFNYEPSRRALASDGPVTFVQGRLVGRAKKGKLDALDSVIALDGDVVIAGFDHENRPLHVRAGSVILRKDGGLLASSGVTMKTEDLVLRSRDFQRGVENEVEGLKASGNACVLMVRSAEDEAGLSAWAQGEEASVYRDATGVPQQLTLTRSVPLAQLDVAPGTSSGARSIVSDRLETRFENGRPAELLLPNPFVLSESMALSEKDPDAGFRTLSGTSGRLLLGPDGQTVTSAAITGPVTGSQGVTIKITGMAASYLAGDQTISVSGVPGTPATYEDRRGRVRADVLTFLSAKQRFRAEGSVKATFSGAEGVSFPGSEAKEPFYSESDSLEMFAAERQVVFTGAVRAWQRENVLRSARLLLDDKERFLRAEGDVKATFRRKTAGPGKPAGIPATEIINAFANTLIHRETEKLVRLEGKSTVVSGQWRLDADVTDIHLSASRTIESAEARGSVELDDPATKRHGQGDRATWFPATEVMTLEGNPAKAADGQGNRMQGAVLVFRPGKSRVDVETSKGVRSEGVFRPQEKP